MGEWVSLDWFGWFGWFEGLVVWLVLWFFVWMENARDEMAQRRLYFLVTQKVLFFWCQMCWLAFAFVIFTISEWSHIVKMFFGGRHLSSQEIAFALLTQCRYVV